MSVNEDDGAGVFYKQLPSDICDEEAMLLLSDIYEENEMWTDFSEDDLKQCLEVFSILKMAPGEKIITKDEYATFCGLVLKGTFTAIISPTFTVDLGPGAMVGEMALFEGGTRNADIVTGTDEGGCILAVITFVDLEQLAYLPNYAPLERKLTKMFAVASIKKLRNMTNKVAVTPALVPAQNNDAAQLPTHTLPPPAQPTTTTTTAATTPAAAAATPAATSATAAPGGAGDKKDEKKEETKAEDKKEKGKKAPKQAAAQETLYKNKMNSRSVRGSTIETQKQLDEEQQKRIAAERGKRNHEILYEKALKDKRELEETNAGLGSEITRLNGELDKKSAELKSEKDENHKHQKEIEELNAVIKSEQTKYNELQAKLMLADHSQSETVNLQLTTLQADLTSKQGTISKLEQERDDKVREIQVKEHDIKAHKDTIERMDAEKLALEKQLNDSKTRIATLENDMSNSNKESDDFKYQNHNLQLRLVDMEEKLSSAQAWKLKALEFQSGLEAEKKRHIRLSDDWMKCKYDLEHDLLCYKKILKNFAITIYVKEYKIRKQICILHQRVSEMLLNTLEEHYNNQNHKERNSNTQLNEHMIYVNTNTSKSQTFKSIRKKTKNYLDQLFKTSKLKFILSSLDEEFVKLKGPFEEVQERVKHWRSTSESFFQRNIDLASKLMTLEKQLYIETNQNHNLNSSLQKQNREYERLLKSGTYTSESKHRDEVSSKPHAPTNQSLKNEVELLEARATVLKVHVAQLEQQYLTLMHGLHAPPSTSAPHGDASTPFLNKYDAASVTPVPYIGHIAPVSQSNTTTGAGNAPVMSPRTARLYTPNSNSSASKLRATPTSSNMNSTTKLPIVLGAQPLSNPIPYPYYNPYAYPAFPQPAPLPVTTPISPLTTSNIAPSPPPAQQHHPMVTIVPPPSRTVLQFGKNNNVNNNNNNASANTSQSSSAM